MAEESFGELLRRLRDRAGLSQEAFAEAVGLSRKTIYTIENERGRPRLTDEVEVVSKMAEVLRVPVGVLSSKLGWAPAEGIDWESALMADPRLDEETKQSLATVIRRVLGQA